MRSIHSLQLVKVCGVVAGVLGASWVAGCAPESPVDSDAEIVEEGDGSEGGNDVLQPDIDAKVSSVHSSQWTPPQPPPGQEVCVTIKRGVAGNVKDAFLAGDFTNYATGAEINMYSGISSGGNANRVLLGFDLSPVPAYATITSATMAIYKSWSGDNATVNVHRATAAWNEATVTRESFGNSFDAAAEGSFTGGGVGMKTVNLTNLVTAWAGGTAPNYGVVLEEAPIASHHYFSSEAGVAFAPSLDVCYVAASCGDGIQNQGESGVDCGGPCNACGPTCVDGIKNGAETGVDCGGGCPACPAQNIKVGVMTGGWYTDGIRQYLASQPNIISATQISSCSAATLNQYNVVLLYGNMNCFSPADFNTYVQNGGGVVATPWIHQNNGGFAALPVAQSGGSSPVFSTSLNVSVTAPNDLLLDGVSFVNGNSVGYENTALTLRPGAVNAVNWNTGNPAAAHWTYGNGRAVYLNFHYITSDCSLAGNYAWGQKLMYNAIRWAGKSVD